MFIAFFSELHNYFGLTSFESLNNSHISHKIFAV